MTLKASITFVMEEKICNLKSDLKSITKNKLCTERDASNLRVTATYLCNELSTIKSELDFLTKSLEESKSQIANARHQLDMIGICTASEKSKVNSHINNLNVHKKGFNELFNRERLQLETREKELREKEADELETERQKKKMAATRNEQRAREAVALDAEADAIEKACIVLKKRNNAIMLKLRRKLVETEDARRELMKLKYGTNNAN